MKKSKILLSLIGTSLLALTSCSTSPLESFKKNIDSSIKKTSKVVLTSTITDDNTEVYKLEKTITLIYDGKSVSGIVDTVESTLSSNFTYVSSSLSDTFDGKTSDIKFNLNLSDIYFETYTLEEGVLTAEVKKDSVESFFNVDDLDCASNPHLVITLEDKRIISYDCSYSTESGKDVVISVSYTYDN